VASPRELINRVQASLPARAWKRYGQARGGVLAGGMAYVAFFSLFPALAIGFTVFGLVVHDDDMKSRVIEAVNKGIGTPIIMKLDGTGGGVVDLNTLTESSKLTIAAIVGLVGFLLTGLGWLDAMREGIRAMFGQGSLEANVVKTKLRDLFLLVSIGLVLLVSAIGGVAVSSVTGTLLGWVGLDSGSTPGRLVLGAVGTLVVLAVDVMVFLLIFRLLSGVHVPRHDYWDAALFGGIGLGVLKLFAGVLLGSAGHNKFLATAGVLLGLLVWLNLVSRLTLVAAAWGATVALDRGHLTVTDGGLLVDSVPGASSSSGSLSSSGSGGVGSRLGAGAGAGVGSARSGSLPAGRIRPVEVPVPRPGGPTPAVPFVPVVSPRSADRVSIAAGAVLGASGLYAARVTAGAFRSVIDAVRRRD
jgi:membrane protein